jgi:hypothetical protein
MAGEDPGSAVNQDGRVETELTDACGDLRNLSVGVGARIPRVRDQLVERPVFDAACH